MDRCGRCGAELTLAGNPFLRCARCGKENDATSLVLACADDEPRGGCDWCDESLCVHYTRGGTLVARVA